MGTNISPLFSIPLFLSTYRHPTYRASERLAKLARKRAQGQARVCVDGVVSPQPLSRPWGPHLVISQRPLAIVLHLFHQLITGRLREDGEPVDVRARLGKAGTQSEGSRVAPPHPPRSPGSSAELAEGKAPRVVRTLPHIQVCEPSEGPHECPQGAEAEGRRKQSSELAFLSQGHRDTRARARKGPCTPREQSPQALGGAEEYLLLTPGPSPTVDTTFGDVFPFPAWAREEA